jgi:cytochrome c peroxidase
MLYRITTLTLTGVGLLCAQGGRGPGGLNGGAPLAALSNAVFPQPSNLGQYVRDEAALVVLGKALFWDIQAGSDGRTACATCHFHAGADHRLQNQLASPHTNPVAVTPNRTLTLSDFPFRLLQNPQNNRSAVVREMKQVAGSAGLVSREFFDIEPGSPFDALVETQPAGPFVLDGLKLRQVTARNTPSVINAVFNVRNFWDGRASVVFSGASPFGDADTTFLARVWKDGSLQLERVRMEQASLASQAVGPALDDVEMSYSGRTWAKLGHKLLQLAPLGRQRVAPDDSVLGAFANPDGRGLAPAHSYPSLIQAAFHPAYWESPEADAGGLSQMEVNFPLFWGLAIQAYESTLVSGESRFDQFQRGNTGALSNQEQQGLREFSAGGSQCLQCHQGPELSAASFTNFQRRTGNGANPDLPDTLGFFRLGVSPVSDDPGGAGRDGFDNPLFPHATAQQTQGVFKAPSLRNVELTGPYFHNGGQATLEQVLDFYSRRGDFPDDGNLGPGVAQINLGAGDRTSIVAFLKSLTDDRVRFERAPFDHPEICVPTGHVPSASGTLQPEGATLAAVEQWALIPATGSGGNDVPLHTLTQPCTP